MDSDQSSTNLDNGIAAPGQMTGGDSVPLSPSSGTQVSEGQENPVVNQPPVDEKTVTAEHSEISNERNETQESTVESTSKQSNELVPNSPVEAENKINGDQSKPQTPEVNPPDSVSSSPNPITTPPSGGGIGSGSQPPVKSGPVAHAPEHNHVIYFFVAIITLIVGLVFGYLIRDTIAASILPHATGHITKVAMSSKKVALPTDAKMVTACVAGIGTLYAKASDEQNGPFYIVNKGWVIGLEYRLSETSIKQTPITNLAGNQLAVNHVNVSYVAQKPGAGFYLLDLYSIDKSAQGSITCPVVPTAAQSQNLTTVTPGVSPSANPTIVPTSSTSLSPTVNPTSSSTVSPTANP